ncbi:hypothetical protein F2Q68_00035241 [Brassica cretica]|uniref:Uncharacterized protein n=1 Tax=Brassica cretica TaxID=69181 RepID=A0A8S9H7C5_BRACR|nr:hypothetical protein F2Q68_00035241 [Brassica cretica]
MNEMAIQPPRFLSGELLGFLAFSRTSISGDDHNELKKATTSKDEEDCLLPYDRSLKFRISNRDFSSRTEQLAGSPETSRPGGGGGFAVGLSMISLVSNEGGGAQGRRRFEIRAGVWRYV